MGGRMDRGKISYAWDAAPEVGVPRQVAEGVEWLRLPLPMKLDHVNCWILDEGDDTVTLVDTGFDSARTRSLWAGALGGRRVARVVVTHHHPDHIGLAGWFQAEQGAELMTSRTSWLMGRMLQLDEQARPSPETVAFWRAAGMDPQILAARLEERPFNFADVVAPLPLGYTRLVDEHMVELGGRWWHIHTGDGHAPEHVTLWEEGGDLILGGDQLLASISPNLGVYATEPDADPVAEWMASCEKLLGYATPDKLVLPGHHLPYRGLPTRMVQLIENHQGALLRLEDHLQEPAPASACFQTLFGRRIGAAEYGLALVEAVAHCLHLTHLGRVRREVKDGVWLFSRIEGAGLPLSAGDGDTRP
ncbi:MBL fold metallo-hydrolase [Palleronia rufa]|uniref:MBL fold metallo-hydrolase n=2 Tax=Palleronia rufa TaxID=1530186 RepID=UPI00068E4A63|nr:MBL fold metallo-hydrolase [Palleronia rufa]